MFLRHGLGGIKRRFTEVVMEDIFVTYWISLPLVIEGSFDLLAVNTTNRKGFVALLFKSITHYFLVEWGVCVSLNSFRLTVDFSVNLVSFAFVVVLIRKKLETPRVPVIM